MTVEAGATAQPAEALVSLGRGADADVLPPAPPLYETRPAPPLAAAAVGVVIVCRGDDGLPPARQDLAQPVVSVVARSADAPSVRGGGASTVETPRDATLGRMRNAGYRQLKKLHPDLRYAQFIDADDQLAADWLDVATRFMDRRPEVAVLAGRAAAPAARPKERFGETRFVGPALLIRAEAFEAAGGFRGDLTANECVDLCVRLRRRGAHVWTLDTPMTTSAAKRGWWKEAIETGYRFAHGSRLHGEPPERLFVGELLGAVIWGAAAPAAVLTIAAAAAVFFYAKVSPKAGAAAAIGVISVGVLAYVARACVAWTALRTEPRAFARALKDTFGQFAMFLGACKFYGGGVDPRRGLSS